MIVHYRRIYPERNHSSTRPYPGVLETIPNLGGRKSTATTKGTPTSRLVLEKFGLLPYFDHVQGTDGFPSKPAPDVLFKSIEHFEVAPAHCLFVGDSAADMEAGRRAGVKTCAVRYGYGDPAAMAQWDPTTGSTTSANSSPPDPLHTPAPSRVILNMKPARPLALLTLALTAPITAPLTAGILHGVTLENQTSRPLARARVQLLRLDGNQLVPAASTIASRTGQFLFRDLPAGYYQLSATRPGFAEARYGQRRNHGSGSPILLDADTSQFIELRLKRLGAITGRVTDENGVGLPGIPVNAYTGGPLMTLVATATSDDRGVYRVTGLLPGPHLIRTSAARLEDGFSLLPTYHPFTSTLLREARTVIADLDDDTPDVDIQPAPGRLANLTVKVQTCIGAAQITLSSETGRRQAIAPCNLDPVAFEGLSPGEYELLAEGQSDRQPVAAFQSLSINVDREIGLSLHLLPELVLHLDGTAGLPLASLGLTLRRRDLAGFGPARVLDAARLSLPPGFYQIAAHPPASHYLADIKPLAAGYTRSYHEPHPDWFDLYLDTITPVTVSCAAHPAQISGRVQLSGKPAIAAPVYLLPTSQPTRRRMNGLRTAYTDANGNYQLTGLAPGAYLLLSSLDIAEVTEETMNAAQARAITLEEGRTLNLDLDLHQIP